MDANLISSWKNQRPLLLSSLVFSLPIFSFFILFVLWIKHRAECGLNRSSTTEMYFWSQMCFFFFLFNKFYMVSKHSHKKWEILLLASGTFFLVSAVTLRGVGIGENLLSECRIGM